MPTYPVATTLVPMIQIHPNPDQPRKTFDPQAHEDLKKSLTERGLISPICVVKRVEGDYMIVAGERRYRAAKDLGWSEIDARIWPAETTPQEIEMLSLVENLQRDDLKLIEVANGYKRLTQPPYEMTHEQIADQCGQGRTTVSQYLMIGALEPQVQEVVNRLTNLGLRHLLQICRLKTPEEQLELAKKASEGDWTVKKLAGEVNKKVASPGDPKASGDTPSPAGRGTARAQGEAGTQPFQFKLSGSDVLITARIPITGNIGVELGKLKEAILQWLNAHQGRQRGQSPEVDLNTSSGTVPRSEPQSPNTEMRNPRLPQTPEEEKELEDIAVKQGPQAVYAWIFGADSPMVQAMPATWAEMGITDPLQALRQILDGIRQFQGSTG
jgi:ParB/RepB/Spo0J family partition protein